MLNNKKIKIGETAGFCFGVSKAIETVNALILRKNKVCTLGEIINNPTVIENFEKLGVKVIRHPKEADHDSIVVVRSHGVAKNILEFMKTNSLKFVDCTCPFVKKIQKIVDENTKNDRVLFAAGNKNHPEMIGICSYCHGDFFVFKDLEELKILLKNHGDKEAIFVAQTTFDKKEWSKCTLFLENNFTNSFICDTICNTTCLRQAEAENLAKNSDIMVVLGGKDSENTKNLFKICKKFCRTIFAEKSSELKANDFKNIKKIGIMAGASTPIKTIEEVKIFLNKL